MEETAWAWGVPRHHLMLHLIIDGLTSRPSTPRVHPAPDSVPADCRPDHQSAHPSPLLTRLTCFIVRCLPHCCLLASSFLGSLEKEGREGGRDGGRGGCVCVFTATSSPAVNGFQVNRFPFLPDSPAFSPVCCLISSSLYQQSIIQGLVFLSVAWFFSPMLTYAYGKSHFLYLPASLIFSRWNFQFFSPIYAPRPQLSPFRQWHL